MNPLYEDLFFPCFISADFDIISSTNLVVPKAVIEIPETAAPPSLPQTGRAVPAKKGKPLVPSDTLTTARYVI